MASAFRVSAPESINDICEQWLVVTKKKSFGQWFRVWMTCAGLWAIWNMRNAWVHNEKAKELDCALASEAKSARIMIRVDPVGDESRMLSFFGIPDTVSIDRGFCWKPLSKGVCLNIAVVEVNGSVMGGAVLRRNGGELILTYKASFLAVANERDLMTFIEMCLGVLKEESLPCDEIQSSHHCMVCGDGNNIQGSDPFLFYKFRWLRSLYNFSHFSRVCSFVNQGAIAVAFKCREGVAKGIGELPVAVQKCISEDFRNRSGVCSGSPCHHAQEILDVH